MEEQHFLFDNGGDILSGPAEKGKKSPVSAPVNFPTNIDDTEAKYLVNKSNKLVNGQNNLSLNANKLLSAAIALINPEEPNRDETGHVKVEMDYDLIASLLKTEKRMVKRFIKEAADAYHSIPIQVVDPQTGIESIVNIAHRSTPLTGRGTFEILFHKDIESEIIELNRFTRYELGNVVDMSSSNTFSLYELLCKAYNQKKGGVQFVKIPLDKLFYRMGITNSMGDVIKKSYAANYSLFRQKVLVPACEEMNKITDLNVSFTNYKDGRKVIGVNFRVHRNVTESVENPGSQVSHAQIKEGLKKLTLSEKVIDAMYKKFDPELIKNNYLFLAEKQEQGLAIKNPPAFFQYLTKNNIASLPDNANPFSDLYKSVEHASAFIKEIVVPIWWRLSDDFRDEVGKENLLKSYLTCDEFQGFLNEAQRDGIDMAVMCADQEEILFRWNQRFEKVLSGEIVD